MKNNVFVIGGTGYVGEKVVEELKKQKYTPIILSRTENKVARIKHDKHEMRIYGDVADLSKLQETLAILKPQALIYLIGLIKESKPKQTFENAHFRWAVDALQLSKKCSIPKFIYMSANGVKQNGTEYQTSKHRFEQYLKQTDTNWTIIRPSLILGNSRKYHFISELKKIMSYKLIPLPTNALFAPVSRNDVAKVIVKSLSSKKASKQTFQLCGPKKYTFEKLLKVVAKHYRKKVFTVPFPEIIFKAVAFLPRSPFSIDQIHMLQEGNTCQDNIGWKNLNINPQTVESILSKEY